VIVIMMGCSVLEGGRGGQGSTPGGGGGEGADLGDGQNISWLHLGSALFHNGIVYMHIWMA
jgi:hypothetical protein